jgi:hypothetical protein
MNFFTEKRPFILGDGPKKNYSPTHTPIRGVGGAGHVGVVLLIILKPTTLKIRQGHEEFEE